MNHLPMCNRLNSCCAIAAGLAIAVTSALHAQVSKSAYRTLGQRDLRQNGLNLVEGFELRGPSGVAVDTRSGQLHLYISDTGNHRVLAWRDISSYQNGDAPALVLGQPGRQFSSPSGIGVRGFNGPIGMAVHPTAGDLYVADFGNNRVLRFPDPFANPTRVEPDAVFGQSDFTRSTAGTSKTALNRPRAIAFDAGGNLWVADSGNHRVVRFAASVLNSATPPDADLVIGQKDFTTGSVNAAGTVSASGFDTPAGLAFDSKGDLYVSDLNNTRVLKFSGPFSPSSQSPSASAVWGQNDFRTRGVPQQASASTLAGPGGLAIDGSGNLYVAVPADNRVLVFGTDTASGAAAKNVLGQSDFTSTVANTGAVPAASPNTLFAPFDVKVDPNGTVFVADSGNHRVLSFNRGSKTGARVWGQTDFVANSPNQMKPGSINAAAEIAIDYSSAPYALYVADVGNNRVLIWKDSTRFRNGDPADLVIGQADFRGDAPNAGSRNPQTPSRTSLSSPRGLAIDQSDGTLYVADSGNNRVLRYPRPVSQIGQIVPDAVIGQFDFTSATSAAVSASSLNMPAGLALGPGGNLFVADRRNNRVLEFASRPVTGASAIRVYGQPNPSSSILPSQVSAQTLAEPNGVYVDSAYNLYVADTGANRLLIFPNTEAAPPAGMAAAFVIGQNSFDSASGSVLKAPTDVAVDSGANIYVADYGNNRILVFPPLVFLPIAGGAPSGVVGQRDLTGTAANWNASPGLATPEGLYGPAGIYLDRQDTLYVGDTGNSRVVHFLKAASIVNSATFQGSVPIAPGGLAAIFGVGLANETASTARAPWPVSLAQREVVINDEIAAPLQFIGGEQINIQVPSSAPLGSHRIAVRRSETGELIAGGALVIAASSPGLFTLTQNGRGQAAAVNQDGRVNGPSNPAAKNSIVTLYGTGQGQVSPPVPDGEAASASPLSSTVSVPTSDSRTCVTSQPSMCVAVGVSFGDIQYSGLAPGFVGLWQINVRIPADAPAGDAVPVRVVINGAPSNTVSIAIR